jgi:Kef-type K+ transport system membrane component KefB
MDTKGLETLLAVALVAALAPMIVAALPGPRIPQVVILILAGIVIGPHVLGLADTGSVRLIANVGLGFLFLLAGYELDPLLLREHAGKLAIGGWFISAAISVGAVAALVSVGYVRDFIPIGLALTTTALGTLLPILHDNDMLSGRFGPYVLAAGAVGELFPIVAIALFLTHRGEFIAVASIVAVGIVAVMLTILPRFLSAGAMQAIVRQGRRATAQTTLRWAIVLLLVLLVAAANFGLDVVLGALLAGMVLRSWTRRMAVDVSPLEEKLDAVGYGFFIPVFFVSSGMTLDIKSIAQNPLRLLIFFVLLLVVRGLPSLVVYRHTLSRRQRIEMTFITATTMPLLIALAEIGLSDHVMIPANAAALVGAGVLSVLVYPSIAVALVRRGRAATAEPAAASGLGMTGDGGVVGAARAAGEPSVAREADAADDFGISPAE